jgi:pimeloyl-ACP methyl ester carboxylesterase
MPKITAAIDSPAEAHNHWQATSPEPYVPPPSAWLALTEAHRAVAEIISLRFSKQLLKRAPKGDGHPIMVLPGFLASDSYNAALRRYLTKRNYLVHGWGLGRNLGPQEGVLEALRERVKDLAEHYQGPISLVGHSLGGVFARELAKEHPELIRQVISLGSPFGEGRLTGSIPARLFVALNPLEALPVDQEELHVAPPVPTTAIYSRGDGIVNWQTTVQINGHEHTQSIRVRGSHCGMTLNPAIWFLVAERLAQQPAHWRPFEVSSWGRLLYPRVHD